MKNKNYSPLRLLVVVLMFLVSFPIAKAQTTDSTQTGSKDQKNFKNTVRINITNPLIFGKSYILGYERTIGHKQSFSINIGTFSLPELGSLDLSGYTLEQSKDVGGFNISADYRFYQSKVNRYDAPRGVYIGPYAAFNKTHRNMTLTSPDVEGQFDAGYEFKVGTLGFQLGYQFVFWNRVSLDMILMGPGISAYSWKTSISTTLDPAKEEELFQKINDALAARIPGWDKVIEPGEMHKNDTFNTTSAGFRYMVMLGFRF
jgi:hypothetical protein